MYTWPGLDNRVLFRLAAAAAAIALPAVLGKVTSVFSKTVSTCNRYNPLGAKEIAISVRDVLLLVQRKQQSLCVDRTVCNSKRHVLVQNLQPSVF